MEVAPHKLSHAIAIYIVTKPKVPTKEHTATSMIRFSVCMSTVEVLVKVVKTILKLAAKESRLVDPEDIGCVGTCSQGITNS